MFQVVLNKVGYVVQVYVLYSIHIAVYYEITSIEEYLLSLSKYDRDFNHLTGWPVYFLTMYYYYNVCTMQPGKVRKNWDLYCKGDRYAMATCPKCSCSKPLRTSHCRKCDVCICRRDHHCFFTNNCIGATNHKAFIWFLIFGLLGSLHFIYRGSQWQLEWYYGTKLEHYSTFYALLMSVHIYNMMGFSGLLGYLTFKTIKNAISNASTMEGWMERRCCGDSPMNLYDLGIISNWVGVLGMNPLLWFSISPPAKHSVPLGPEFPTKPEFL